MRLANRNSRHLVRRDGGPPGTSSEQIDIDSLLLAHYVCQHLTYDQIIESTGISRATLARRLAYAREKGYLVEELRLHVPDNLKKAYVGMIRDIPLEQELKRRLQSWSLRSVVVVSTQGIPRGNDTLLVKRVASVAADRLSAVLARGKRIVGINWGYSVRHTIEALKSPDKPNRDLTLVPLMGNMSVDEANRKEYEEAWLCAANRLARLVSELFGCREPRRLTTPAIIPEQFAQDSEKLDAIWDFIEHDISYQRIFGSGHHRGTKEQRALVDKLDIIITGMSGLQKTSSLVGMARIVREGELLRLQEAGYVGDLGGHLVADPAKEVTDRAARSLAEKVDSLVVGPKPDDFVRVARRARDDQKSSCGGVYLIGRGKKSAALVAACKLGAVTELYTDAPTARAMIHVLDSQGA